MKGLHCAVERYGGLPGGCSLPNCRHTCQCYLHTLCGAAGLTRPWTEHCRSTCAHTFRPHNAVDTVLIMDAVYASNFERLEPVNIYYC
jgi:hypothetical protein